MARRRYGEALMLTNADGLNSMTIDELWSLHEEVIAVLSGKILEQKRELEKRLALLNPDLPRVDKTSGLRSAGEFRPAPADRPRRKYPKVLPRFRNPDTDETWSGRGKQPRWLIAATEAGRSIDEFRIDKY
jgi:DNA-binding protein H-NS